jgi:hypothetical protein
MNSVIVTCADKTSFVLDLSQEAQQELSKLFAGCSFEVAMPSIEQVFGNL